MQITARDEKAVHAQRVVIGMGIAIMLVFVLTAITRTIDAVHVNGLVKGLICGVGYFVAGFGTLTFVAGGFAKKSVLCGVGLLMGALGGAILIFLRT